MRSLERVLSILEQVSMMGSASPTRVAEKLGLAPSTVARVMRDMSDQDLLSRTSARTYSVGERFLLLAETARLNNDPLARIRPLLDRLRDRSRETATLHVLRGERRICIASAESPHPIRRVGQVGEALPVNRSATAEVLLSGLSPAERQPYLDEMMLSPDELQEFTKRLDESVDISWSIHSDDWIPDVTGISAAVRRIGRTVAAMTIAGPVNRFDQEAALAMRDDLLEAAREVSAMGANVWWP